MIKYKTLEEIEIMRVGGEIASKALQEALSHVKVGVTLADLDEIVDNFITNAGAQPAFKFVEDYSYATCINVNDGIVHGIPDSYSLKAGDLVSIDLGVLHEGFNTDLSYTVEVETSKESNFLSIGKKSLHNAIEKCVAGNTIGDVSYEMQRAVESEGYSVSTMLVGHGIGRTLHESPHVPCYGRPGKGPLIKTGMVLAIEVIYQKGGPDLIIDESDGWTIRTADGTLSGLFECTVAVLAEGNVLITRFD